MSDYGRTKDGTPITEEMVQRWAAEAEAGYDLAKLKPRQPTLSEYETTAYVRRSDFHHGSRHVFIRLVPRGAVKVADTVVGDYVHIDLDAEGNILGMTLSWGLRT